MRIRSSDANALVEAAARGEIMELERFRRQIRGPDGRVQPIEVIINNQAVDRDDADPRRLRDLQGQLEKRHALLEELSERLNQPGLTAEEKMRIGIMIQSETRAINRINLEINDLSGPRRVEPKRP